MADSDILEYKESVEINATEELKRVMQDKILYFRTKIHMLTTAELIPEYDKCFNITIDRMGKI